MSSYRLCSGTRDEAGHEPAAVGGLAPGVGERIAHTDPVDGHRLEHTQEVRLTAGGVAVRVEAAAGRGEAFGEHRDDAHEHQVGGQEGLGDRWGRTLCDGSAPDEQGDRRRDDVAELEHGQPPAVVQHDGDFAGNEHS